MRPTVYVLTAGGTISERSTEVGAVAMTTGVNDLLSQLESLDFTIELKRIMDKASPNIVPGDWIRIAEATAAALKAEADGVVILHGTDTMHYTAAALSFMLRDLGKPVIMTGSMIPGGDLGSDALFNLKNAVTVAAFADIAEVCIVFSADSEKRRGVIVRGCRARKVHTVAINAFTSINIPPVGYVKNGKISYTEVKTRKRGFRDLKLSTKLDPNVVFVKQNPALSVQTLTRFLDGASGAVVEGTGAGHVRADLIEVIASFECPVVMSTQAMYGGVRWGFYASDRLYLGAKNIIPAGDMTSETALVKLMWALGKGGDIRSTMLANIAGELTECFLMTQQLQSGTKSTGRKKQGFACQVLKMNGFSWIRKMLGENSLKPKLRLRAHK